MQKKIIVFIVFMLLFMISFSGCLDSGKDVENEFPSVVVYVNKDSGSAPLEVEFSIKAYDPYEDIQFFHVDFGDGESYEDYGEIDYEYNTTNLKVSHTYSHGEFTATITVTNDKGSTGNDTIKITVTQTPNKPPTAQASATPTKGTVPLTVYFTGSGSDTDGSINSYSWSFGDGYTSNLRNPSHTYQNVGYYKAELTVTDDEGSTGTDYIYINVEEKTLGDKIIGEWHDIQDRISYYWIFTSDKKLTLDDQTVEYGLLGSFLNFYMQKHYTLLGETYYYTEYYAFTIELDNDDTLILNFIEPSEFSGQTIVLTR